VEPGTHPRGLLDTKPTRLVRFFALAVALHVPFSPALGFLGLLRLTGNETEAPALPPVTEIPLDIIDDDDTPGTKPADTPEAREPEATTEAAAPAPQDPDPAAIKPKPPKELPDAGAPEARDAGSPDASKTSDAGAAEDAGNTADGGPAHKPGEGIASPVAGIGDKRVVDPNANVQLLVHTDRVRQHPLGSRIGPLLRNVYQWRDFFGPTAIDPIRDIDRMLIVGSQLRDSRDVVAILQFNVPQERVRAAVDVLVTRDPEGGWLDAGVPVAKAHADRGERVFVFPSPHVLVVTPPSAQASAERLPRKFRLPTPKGDEIALAKLATPWRAFLGLPVAIPKSIRSAELRLSPRSDGGVVIDILAHDESEELAKSDAGALTAALTAATSLNLGMFGAVLFGSSQKKFIEKGSFEPDGSDIRGEIVLTRAQVETVLELASGFLGGRAPRPRAPSLPSSASSPQVPQAPVAPTPAPAASP
jgi:hypothetical protein